jgi:hypothetical protein
MRCQDDVLEGWTPRAGDHAERLDQRRKVLLDNMTRLTATSVTTVSSKRDGAIKPPEP